MAICVIGKVCPGIKNRTGAFIAGAVSLALGLILVIVAMLGMIFTYRTIPGAEGARSNSEREMVQCYYGAGFALWGTWILCTIFMMAGIRVENKRALGLWLIFNIAIPVYFVIGLIFLLATKLHRSWEVTYLIAQGVTILALIWVCLAVWVYFGEIRLRDKNPEMRENEEMLTTPFSMMLPPAGSYNPGYGAPGGSMSSIPRSHRSRMTYAPTEVSRHTYAPNDGESVRTGYSMPRQSRLDQYRSQKGDRSPEREGGTGYYRYQYTAEQNKNPQQQPPAPRSVHGSQGSLSGVGRQYSHQQTRQYNYERKEYHDVPAPAYDHHQVNKDSEV